MSFHSLTRRAALALLAPAAVLACQAAPGSANPPASGADVASAEAKLSHAAQRVAFVAPLQLSQSSVGDVSQRLGKEGKKPVSVWKNLPATKPGDIKLIDAGAEPRRALRYDLSKAAGGRLRMTTASKMSVEVQGQKRKAGVVPKLEMVADLKVRERNTQGTRFVIDLLAHRPRVRNKKQLPELLQKALDQALGKVGKLKGKSVVTDRGVVKDLDFDLSKVPAGARQIVAELQGNLGRMTAPLPKEPVGIGARWVVNDSVTQQGMKLTQLAVYELVELEGTKGKAKVRMRQKAPKGQVQLPGLPKGAKTELVRMTSWGKGETEFDLKTPVPRGRVKTSATITLRATQGAQTQSVTMRIKSLLRFRPPKK